jgi:hypothetical protein
MVVETGVTGFGQQGKKLTWNYEQHLLFGISWEIAWKSLKRNRAGEP